MELFRQVYFNRLSMNWATVDVAKVMSGLVPIETYMRAPTASRYGTFFM